jgi:hypothetical protein
MCLPSASYSSPPRYLQLPLFALSLRFPASQIFANTTVCAQPHIPPLRLLATTTVHAQPHILPLSYTCNYQCSLSASYSLLRPWPILVFTLSLIFPSSQILATTSVCAQPPIPPSSQIPANTTVCAQPHIPLYTDTLNYQCSRSASYSPPVRYSQIPVFFYRSEIANPRLWVPALHLERPLT